MLNSVNNNLLINRQYQASSVEKNIQKNSYSALHVNNTLPRVPFASVAASYPNISFGSSNPEAKPAGNVDAKVAPNNTVAVAPALQTITAATSPIDLKISNSSALTNFNLMKNAKEVVSEVNQRAGKPGQFLNWIGVLPQNQLKEVDRIYSMAQSAPQPGIIKDVVMIGIGGSRHPTEAMTGMLNINDKKVNVHYYSGIDQESLKRTKDKIDPASTLFVVVSKKGTTLETLEGYKAFREMTEAKLGKEEAKKHFVAMTDANPEKSELRKSVVAGDIPVAGLVHDDVGGRFCVFDDPTLFTLAYLGMKKEDMTKMLQASDKAQKKYMSTDINENKAMQQAMFNADAIQNGKRINFVEYFGDAFAGATLWDKQKNNESLKNLVYTDTNVGPAYLHYNAESDLHKDNKDSFYTFVNVNPGQDKKFASVLSGVTKAYSSMHPVSHITLPDLKPETVAEFMEFQHFNTLYTGILARRLKGDITPTDKPVPEVLQPNVEIYKKEVNAALKQAA